GYCMTLSSLFRVDPISGVTARVTGERSARMQTSGYRFVSLPTAMMSLLGAPVRDPPGSSSETASEASGVTNGTRLGGTVMRTGWLGAIRPSERGRACVPVG